MNSHLDSDSPQKKAIRDMFLDELEQRADKIKKRNGRKSLAAGMASRFSPNGRPMALAFDSFRRTRRASCESRSEAERTCRCRSTIACFAVTVAPALTSFGWL